jgi:hypothetical protein
VFGVKSAYRVVPRLARGGLTGVIGVDPGVPTGWTGDSFAIAELKLVERGLTARAVVGDHGRLAGVIGVDAGVPTGRTGDRLAIAEL